MTPRQLFHRLVNHAFSDRLMLSISSMRRPGDRHPGKPGELITKLPEHERKIIQQLTVEDTCQDRLDIPELTMNDSYPRSFAEQVEQHRRAVALQKKRLG